MNDVPCIPRVRLRLVRVLWVLVQGFRLRDQLGLGLVRELRRGGLASGMFHVV